MSELTDLRTQILANYKGYSRFVRLLRLVERIGRTTNWIDTDKEFIFSTLFLIYEMGIKEKIYGVCEEVVDLAAALGISPEDLGVDVDTITKNMDNFKSKIEVKKMEIEKAKKAQKKDIVRVEYFNLGELYFSNGQMNKAAEAYRISYCFSISTEDIVKVSIKLGTVSIYNQNYSFGLKFVKEAVFKNLESPKNAETTNLLNTIHALLQVGNYKLNDVSSCLWEQPTCSTEELANLAADPKDLAFYATMAGLMTYSRKKFKDDYYSKPYFRIVWENYSDLFDLGSTYINFDFDRYFKLLNSLQKEFRYDYFLYNHIALMMQKCKKKVMITYITPYKTVDLNEMAKSFGMSIEDTERSVEELIVTNEIKCKINKYNKSLSTKTENYKLESFKKAVMVGDQFIKSMEAMLMKYYLKKKVVES